MLGPKLKLKHLSRKGTRAVKAAGLWGAPGRNRSCQDGTIAGNHEVMQVQLQLRTNIHQVTFQIYTVVPRCLNKWLLQAFRPGHQWVSIAFPTGASLAMWNHHPASSNLDADAISNITPSTSWTRRATWNSQAGPSVYLCRHLCTYILQDPLAYDRLIRQHQSAAEREADGKQRGWASILEGSLLRGEAKLAALKPEDKASSKTADTQRLDWDIEVDNALATDSTEADIKNLALEKWNTLIAERFVSGKDEDFDYKLVDEDESLDDGWAEITREDKWFDSEEEALDGHQGETGIQDF